jgi:hypothetical protein
LSQCKSGYGARRVRSVPRRRLRWIDGSLLTNHLEPYRRAIFTAVLDERDASGRPRYKDGRTGEWRTCATWTIRWYAGGRHHKGGGFPTEKAARRELRAKQEASAQGQYVPGADRTTFEDLATLLLDEYRANGRRSLDRAEDAVTHLREFFDGYRAKAITPDRVLAYVRRRQEAKAANATINRELAALKRCSGSARRQARSPGGP